MVDVDTDEITIGGAADFDYDAETQIRWRGLSHGRGLGSCCYIDPADPDLATTICADGMTRGACTVLDGDFASDLTCADDPCPGACCEDDGAGNFICEDLNQSDCDDVGGVFKGVNTACDDDPDPCTLGACCQTTGCTDEIEGDCDDLGGTWVLDSLCADDPDPCAGACCILDIVTPCQDLNEPDCDIEDGGFQGIGTTCPDDACIVGACCLDSTCELETATGCSDLGGEFQGSGVDCTPDPCAPTGACCDADVCSEETEDDCVDLIGGVYQGDDVPCDPNPCTITGACCQSGSVCSEETRGDCNSLGGSYQGDGTPCDPNPCICPSISMECDSISASGSKCGFPAYDGSNPVYSTETYIELETWSCPDTDCDYCKSHGFNPGVAFTINCNIVHGIDRSTCATFQAGGCTDVTTSCDNSVTVVTYVSEHSTFTTTSATHKEGALTITSFGGCPPPDDKICAAADVDTWAKDLTDEYTTAELISTVEGKLPPYSGIYTGGACASSRFLSSDEHTYSIQRSKPRFLFGVVTTPFTLTYDEVFTPAGGGSPSTVTRSFGVGVGDTSLDGPELLEPSTNGTTSIGNIRCTPV